MKNICILVLGLASVAAHAQLKQSDCPTAAILSGELPPKGDGQWCQIHVMNGKGYVNHGPFVQYFPSKGGKLQKMVEGEFNEGKASGDWHEWWPDGKKKAEGLFKDDKKFGHWLTWHRNGQKATEGFYINDKPRSPELRWDEGGKALPAR